MKISELNEYESHQIIGLKDNIWLDKQREAGNIVARTLLLLKNICVKETSYFKYTLKELSEIGENFIEQHGAVPTFKGYNGFPFGVCISVNEDVVHGVPTDNYLNSGDVVTFDLGATIDGSVADSAMTFIVGEPRSQDHINLIKATNDCLYAGINAIKVGSRLGVIGAAISLEAKKHKFSSILDYGGHGLGYNGEPHADPFVSNSSTPYEGIRIQSGLAIAIEPQLVDSNSIKTKVMEDGWTVRAKGISAHQEHSVFIHDDYVEIITDREGLE